MRKTWLAGAILILAGCAGLPQHVKKYPSVALQTPQNTELARVVQRSEDGTSKNLSGIRLLASGEEALDSLIALADHAQRTLDIQYYIIHEDDSARLLLHHVRLAAARGVRVRVLVDDLNTAGEDRRFMHLSERENIEVRVFNPFPGGRFATWTRFVASASDSGRRTITEYAVYDDGADGGYFELGNKAKPDGHWIKLTASQLEKLKYVAGSSAGTETLSIKAYDGHQWSSVYSTTATTVSPQPPDIISLLQDPGIAADVSKPEGAKMVDDWVNDNTKGVIPEILGKPLDRPSFIALNALHFKAKWKEPFDPKQTAEAPFVGSCTRSEPTMLVPGSTAIPSRSVVMT